MSYKKHSVTDYYVPLLKMCLDNNLNDDIGMYIFSFIKKDISHQINLDFIHNEVTSHIKYAKNIKYIKNDNLLCNFFTLHLHDLPYPMNIYHMEKTVSQLFDTNHSEKCFSHFCCNNSGVVYSSEKDKYKHWYRVI